MHTLPRQVPRRVRLSFACLLVVLLPATLSATAIVPAGERPALDAQMLRHGRQFYGINATPFGVSLDAHVKGDAERTLIDTFLADHEGVDVEAAVGTHPFDLLQSFGEYGDLGFFGGVGVVATAYEYLSLKQEGASAEALAVARARVVRAAESWHVFKVVTGGGGIVARGIRLRVPDDPQAPPIPSVEDREKMPLFDDAGQPLPQPKNNGEYRPDNSQGSAEPLPAGKWYWKDSCSKDQLVGQVFAMAALYDAMKDDPDIDQVHVATLEEDARLIGEMLMKKHEISEMEGPFGSGEYDLIIMDADGRPTMYHDLNPLSLEKVYFAPDTGKFNVFNLFMAIGVLKGLHHISGDPAIERFLYEECLDTREYLGKAADPTRYGKAMDYIYAGIRTNFDNPDMTSIALFLGLYYETDPQVADVLRSFLEERWWLREGESHTARLSKQPLWHAIYLSLTERGTDAALVDELEDLLLGFELGPYWNPQRENCDATEIAAGECLAVDGETIITIEGSDEGGRPLATESLHPSIRPPSNFDARSNPFSVNGGGGNRLNPGGDLLAAYWLARYMQATSPGEHNLSRLARPHMLVGGGALPEPGPEASAEVTEVVEVAEHLAEAGSEVSADLPATPDVALDTSADAKGGDGGGCALATARGDQGLMASLLLLLLTFLFVSFSRARSS